MASTKSSLCFLILILFPVLSTAPPPSSRNDSDTTNYTLLGEDSRPRREDPDTTKYIIVSTKWSSHPLKVRCFAKNRCFGHTLTCPRQCPTRISTRPGASSCFVDCSSKCETSCKHRRPKCYGFGAVCYDPRFVGGDGVMFYFHGEADRDFCLVSDHNLHINAHFIGNRPDGRTRAFTWVQAVAIMFDNHKLSIAAKKVGTWDNKVDHLLITYDGQVITVPEGDGSVSNFAEDGLKMERVADTNSMQFTVGTIMSLSVNVVPITERENKVHNYQIPADDCFAHLELQFKFFELSRFVEGVLGRTYQPDFTSPVKVGVPMPIMGGEDKYRVSSPFATDCKASKFAPQSELPSSAILMPEQGANCVSTSNAGGIICRR